MKYTRKFYEATRINMASALEIVPSVIQLVSPRSVVDLGCGVGGWLAAFSEHGVQDIAGYDGEWVHLDDLLIPQTCFHRQDLSKRLPAERRYDLAVSMEVAEHLPAEAAKSLVESLTRLSSVVLFSAAIPFQGGTHHVNEQWPAYWMRMFGEKGYLVVDCLRTIFWDNPRVRWWYAQNMMLFVEATALAERPALREAHAHENLGGISLVHPRRWEKQCDPHKLPFRNAVRQSVRVLAAKFGRKPAEKTP